MRLTYLLHSMPSACPKAAVCTRTGSSQYCAGSDFSRIDEATSSKLTSAEALRSVAIDFKEDERAPAATARANVEELKLIRSASFVGAFLVRPLAFGPRGSGGVRLRKGEHARVGELLAASPAGGGIIGGEVPLSVGERAVLGVRTASHVLDAREVTAIRCSFRRSKSMSHSMTTMLLSFIASCWTR